MVVTESVREEEEEEIGLGSVGGRWGVQFKAGTGRGGGSQQGIINQGINHYKGRCR